VGNIKVRDTYGRDVELSAGRWYRIIKSHPELAPYLGSALIIMGERVLLGLGRDHDEDCFYVHDVGPSAWIKVVVRAEGRHGEVITAFATRTTP
jgi:hypothetical protein